MSSDNAGQLLRATLCCFSPISGNGGKGEGTRKLDEFVLDELCFTGMLKRSESSKKRIYQAMFQSSCFCNIEMLLS